MSTPVVLPPIDFDTPTRDPMVPVRRLGEGGWPAPFTPESYKAWAERRRWWQRKGKP
jgi:hypothetical protein